VVISWFSFSMTASLFSTKKFPKGIISFLSSYHIA
jgi:hypothetical protein